MKKAKSIAIMWAWTRCTISAILRKRHRGRERISSDKQDSRLEGKQEFDENRNGLQKMGLCEKAAMS